MPVYLLHLKTTPLDSLGGLPLKFSQLRGDGAFEKLSQEPALRATELQQGSMGSMGKLEFLLFFRAVTRLLLGLLH